MSYSCNFVVDEEKPDTKLKNLKIRIVKETLKTIAWAGSAFALGAVGGPIVAAYSGALRIAAAICVPVTSVAVGHQISKQTDNAVEEIVDSVVDLHELAGEAKSEVKNFVNGVLSANKEEVTE